MESLANTVASFNPMNSFNRTLIVAGVALVLAKIALLVLKYVLVYLCKIVRRQIEKDCIYCEATLPSK